MLNMIPMPTKIPRSKTRITSPQEGVSFHVKRPPLLLGSRAMHRTAPPISLSPFHVKRRPIFWGTQSSWPVVLHHPFSRVPFHMKRPPHFSRSVGFVRGASVLQIDPASSRAVPHSPVILMLAGHAWRRCCGGSASLRSRGLLHDRVHSFTPAIFKKRCLPPLFRYDWGMNSVQDFVDSQVVRERGYFTKLAALAEISLLRACIFDRTLYTCSIG